MTCEVDKTRLLPLLYLIPRSKSNKTCGEYEGEASEPEKGVGGWLGDDGDEKIETSMI